MSFSSGLFGAKGAAPSGFGGFGASAANTSTAGQGLFGSTPQNQNQPAGTGLFGNTQNQNQPGQNQAPTQPSTNPFGSFGQPAQPQQQQPAQTGIFGQQQPQQQQPQQPAGSIFGQPQAQQQQNTLFGQTQPQQPQNTPFGQPQTQPQQQPALTTSMFGQPAQQQQATAAPMQNPFGGLGGSTQPNNPLSLSALGGNTNPLGASTQQQQPSFSRSTKFNDLPDEIKKIFEQLDTHIQGRIHIANDLKNRNLGEEIEKCSEEIRVIHQSTQNTANTLWQDGRQSDHLKDALDRSVQDTIAATRIVDGFRNQQTSGMFLKNYASFPLEFFTRVTTELQEKLQWYKNTIEQIERKLVMSATRPQYTPQAVMSTLQNQHKTFIMLANKTAELDGQVQQMKEMYREHWRNETGSKRDPFEGGFAGLDIS